MARLPSTLSTIHTLHSPCTYHKSYHHSSISHVSFTLHGTSHPSHRQDRGSTKCSTTNQGKLEGVVVNLLVEGNPLQKVVPALLRLLPHQEVLLLGTLQLILAALSSTTTWHHWTCGASTIHITHCRGFKVHTVKHLIGCNIKYSVKYYDIYAFCVPVL